MAGLAPEALYQGRDLAVTADFRDVIGEVFAGHPGLREIARVFQGIASGRRDCLQLLDHPEGKHLAH